MAEPDTAPRRLSALALEADKAVVICHIAAPDQEFHQKRDAQTDGLFV